MRAASVKSTTWLSKLALAQLRRVAFQIGAPNSGTKSVLTTQIEHELVASASVNARPKPQQSKSEPSALARKLSIVSIDMGIRNLAYAHLLVDPSIIGRTEGTEKPRPILATWKRVVISSGPNGPRKSRKRKQQLQSTSDEITTELANSDEALPITPLLRTEKEPFDPATFASYAHRFIKDVLVTHQPTHVLIERQRFRSGGGSAVQEWTIRVGVFEGMLHAVLKTLGQEQALNIAVQSVDPGRVTRYWLEGLVSPGKGRLRSAKESKKAKIDIVGASLGDQQASLVEVPSEKAGQEVKTVVDAFLTRWKNSKSSKKGGKANDFVKLDDLSDCFLQGIAWLNWQLRRLEVIQLGEEAFTDDPVFNSAPKKKTRMCQKGAVPTRRRVAASRRTPQTSTSSKHESTV